MPTITLYQHKTPTATPQATHTRNAPLRTHPPQRHAASGIERPRDLDGRKYASYGARYEGRIVQQLIRNDGGTGEFTEDTSMQALGIMQARAELLCQWLDWSCCSCC